MNTYNPKIHHRKSIRLQGFDYSKAGLYFITLICQDRKHIFGKVINGEMILSPNGKIAHDEWLNSITIRNNIALHDFIIMPDHTHVILEILFSKSEEQQQGFRSPSQTIGAIIRGYKGAVTRAIASAGKGTSDSSGKGSQSSCKGELHSPDTSQGSRAENLNQVKGECNSPRQSSSIWQRNYYERIIKTDIAYQRISQYIINNPKKWTEKYG